MGTNYYLHRDICPHCKRPADIIHIGKSLAGWSFSFHGTESIRTFSQWKAEISKPGNSVVDEYGREVSPEDFFTLVEGKREGSNHVARYGGGWIDPEGHGFSEGEFS